MRDDAFRGVENSVAARMRGALNAPFADSPPETLNAIYLLIITRCNLMDGTRR